MTPDQLERLRAFREKVIRYDAMNAVLAEIECLHKSGLHPNGAECVLVIGPSGSGKTCTLELYQKGYPPVREAERDRLPILLVESPARATLKGVAEAVLAALGDPAPWKGTVQSMTRRVQNLLRRRGVELVILDEFQHLVDREKPGQRVAYDAADWIKSLLNARICPFVLSGTELAETVIEANEQLHRRCMSIARLAPMAFGTADERRYFRAILEAFDRELPLGERSGLADPDLAARIHAATGGLIGRVSHLLVSACRLAMRDGFNRLNASVLGDAWASSVTVSSDRVNPFRTKTPPAPEPEPDRSRVTRLHARGRKPRIGELLHS